MKRLVYKLALFLILGAIVNVAVAWGCAWKLDIYKNPAIGESVNVAELDRSKPNYMWSVQYYRRIGAMRVFSYYFAPSIRSSYDGDPGSLLPSWNPDYFYGIQRHELSQELVRIQDGRGWPMLALWGQAVADARMNSLPYCEIEYAILITDFASDQQFALGFYGGGSGTWHTLRIIRFLPLHPIWPGFAINTVFYAALLWLLTLIPFTARRMIRCKRGLCIKCGYDLRGTEHKACPECGNEITTSV